MPITPIIPTYSPGAAHEPEAYGAGAGRSVRGLPILWESPAAEELRGVLSVESVAWPPSKPDENGEVPPLFFEVQRYTYFSPKCCSLS